jgi:sporulation protein YlmC with PRC-barrel domain
MTRNLLILASALALAANPLFTHVSAEEAKSTAALQFINEQPANEWRSRLFIGAAVQNPAGETVGDVNDLVFDHSGRITTVVLGVGGFLGMGEKNVGVPFNALTFESGKDGARVIKVPLSKEDLKKAVAFKPTEKTALDTVKDKAVEIGNSASEKAGEIKDKAVKKVEEMKADGPKKE